MDNINTQININKSKTPLHVKFAYAFGAFGHDFLYFSISLYLVNFITTNLIKGADEATNNFMIGFVTLSIMLVGIIEIFFDPIIGNIIDRTKTKMGHYRPWIIIGGVICSLILCFLYTDMWGFANASSPNYNPILYLVIFVVCFFCMDISLAFNDISFWSMLPALSLDTKEREKNATFARVGATLGDTVIGVVVMPIVLFFSVNKDLVSGDSNGWMWFGIITTILSLVSIFVVVAFTKEKNDPLRKNKEDTKGIKDVFMVILHNRELLWTSISYILYCIAVCTVNALELFYFQYILDYKEGFSTLQTINMFVGVCSVFTFPIIMTKFKRKHLIYVCLSSMIIGLGVFSIAGQNFPLVLVAAELFFIPQPLVFISVLMTITDSVEYGQLKLGHRDESLTLSVRPLCDKLGAAVGNAIVGQTVILAGMTSMASAASISETGIFSFKILMFGLPVLLLSISFILFFRKVKLDEKMHAEIMKKLKQTWPNSNDK